MRNWTPTSWYAFCIPISIAIRRDSNQLGGPGYWVDPATGWTQLLGGPNYEYTGAGSTQLSEIATKTDRKLSYRIFTINFHSQDIKFSLNLSSSSQPLCSSGAGWTQLQTCWTIFKQWGLAPPKLNPHKKDLSK